MTPGALCAVGSIDVLRRARRHPHVVESLACAMALDRTEHRERVIGTGNTQEVELYGWAPNVERHVDNKGLIYFTPLVVGISFVCIDGGEELIEPGHVYRLDDRLPHWTHDDVPVVCAFIGTFNMPCDRHAVEALAAGVAALARGSKHAPRNKPGFRVPLRREVWTENHELVDVDIARRSGDLIARCAMCPRFAWKMDKFFPYDTLLNRCMAHMKEPDKC